MPDQLTTIRYVPEATARRFHSSDAFVRGILGPVGSGKSTICTVELLDRARLQEPHEGQRRTRWGIIRNTYPELISTTMQTWKEWVPESICPISMAAPIHGDTKKVTPRGVRLDDGTYLDMEVYFLALDQDDDVRKLKSLELTGVWINEASEISEAVLKMAKSRVDRYPAKRHGGATWSGVILDTNPPDEESWYYELAEVQRPLNHAFFKQPPAILEVPQQNKDDRPMYVANMGQGAYPAAENVVNHNSGFNYWLRQTDGADREWVRIFLMGFYGSMMQGKPVYNEYVDAIHYTPEDIGVYRGLPLIIGLDFGLSPAAAIAQMSPRGQFKVIDEIATEDVSVREFAKTMLRPHLKNLYGGMEYVFTCDPAGNQRAETDEHTCIQILAEEGIEAEMAQSNRFIARREAVVYFMGRMIDGKPGFILGPKCKVLRKGFLGGYRYRTLRSSTGRAYSAEPEKNKFSHPHDALQYAAMWARGGALSAREQDQGLAQTDALPVSPENWL